MFVIRRAEEKDLFRVRRLIKDAGLNDKGIEKHLSHFFVAETAEGEEMSQMIGVVGMEVHGPYGLLRSFVLERASWNPKVGLNMIGILLSYAKKLKLERVYLLAGASTSFFGELGFSEVAVQDLPEELMASEHLERSVFKGTPMVYTCFSPERDQDRTDF
jgi:amino-acid N-acetyltransferase